MLLSRKRKNLNGIFSDLTDGDELVAYTIERVYFTEGRTDFFPKLPPGEYVCQRGVHTLEHHPEPFEAFEVLNVPGHRRILFHIGNVNTDSEGCVCLGTSTGHTMVMESRLAFDKFMDKYRGVYTLPLTVQDESI